MKLTGWQTIRVAEIADGTDVTLTRVKGQDHVDVHRVEDGLRVRVHSNGDETTLETGRNDGA